MSRSFILRLLVICIPPPSHQRPALLRLDLLPRLRCLSLPKWRTRKALGKVHRPFRPRYSLDTLNTNTNNNNNNNTRDISRQRLEATANREATNRLRLVDISLPRLEATDSKAEDTIVPHHLHLLAGSNKAAILVKRHLTALLHHPMVNLDFLLRNNNTHPSNKVATATFVLRTSL